MGLFKTFQTNGVAERSGKWFEVGEPNEDGTKPKFLLARMASTNPAYQAALERVAKETRSEMELDILTEDRAGPIMRRVFVDTILLGWQNVQEEDGTVLEYNKDTALSLLEQLPDLYLVLRTEASRLANYRAVELETVKGK